VSRRLPGTRVLGQLGRATLVVHPALVGADEALAGAESFGAQMVGLLIEDQRQVAGQAERSETHRETDQNDREDGTAGTSGHRENLPRPLGRRAARLG
jgi:hypothetical protein